MKNHALMHMLGCIIPLLLIMILPSFGVSSNVTYFIFIVLMFGCHLMMLKGHNHGEEHSSGDEQSSEKGGKNHGCH
ncbi:hypothetical protein MNBD_UNCLBAC01-1057 [hydrothermal vent metagenome]|uniref:DUF2933 domain-containing protein n=1 Tax=hydrothermal vent metagenome TaxID=652676 RepID=A0A3B1DLS4_9ZZZZ